MTIDMMTAHRERRRLERDYKRALSRVPEAERETITAYTRALIVELVTARRDRKTRDAIQAIAAAPRRAGDR